MAQRAILFGGIGTLVETSELQRAAFNAAFADADLGWHWQRHDYRAMLDIPGGAARIQRFADARGDYFVDADKAAELHHLKTKHFHRLLASEGLALRPGVSRLLDDCAASSTAVALASTTDRSTIDRLLAAAALDTTRFDLVCDRSLVTRSKPAPEVYHYCLAQLGLNPAAAIAVEDSKSGLQSALAAGLRCVATPGANTRDQDYTGAMAVLNCLGDENSPAESLRSATPLASGQLNLADCFDSAAA